jgi:hypothetical protein
VRESSLGSADAAERGRRGARDEGEGAAATRVVNAMSDSFGESPPTTA